ncbi:MAG: hypothetical protein IJE00_02215 [Clostridia bacterium]|nr:hypothetical protein [Clostridia bacterium]MBQ2939160.1 hypothetical protein [Clostridia bacterium]
MRKYNTPELELFRLTAAIYTVSEEAEYDDNWDDYMEEDANGTSDDAK